MTSPHDSTAQQHQLAEKLLVRDPDPEDVLVDEALLNDDSTGEKQPNQFRDAWAGVLYVSHVLAIFYFAVAWGIPSLNYEYASYGTTDTIHFQGILWLALVSSLLALVVSALALFVMLQNARLLVEGSLVATLASSGLVLILFAWQRYWWGVGFSILALAWGAWYASRVWHRTAFAAANLQIGLTAVQANGGVNFLAFGVVLMTNVFSIFWILAWLGVYVRSTTCEPDDGCTSHVSGVVLLLFLLSYYWTAQVGKNILHVTVAGVVGTWFFAPDQATSFCSPAVTDSLIRSVTFSLGSIALGSLLTAILQVLYHLLDQARRSGRGHSLILCVIECVVGCLERLVAYFNKWAYVYIGLYGYDYLTAGKKVTNLFRQRGWTNIINDDLVARVCGLVTLVIGALTGCLGLALGRLHPGWVDEFGSAATAVSFLFPFLMGTVVAVVTMSVVTSAVDTVVVAFAEAPLDLERNHPGLHQLLVSAWTRVYPEEFGAREGGE